MATRCCWPPESWVGGLFDAVAQAEPRQHLGRLGDRLGPRPAGDHQRDRGVLGRRQGRQQVVLLEHEADVPPAELDLPPAAQRRQVLAEDLDLAGRRVEQAGDDREQRRLAAAGRADEQRHLAEADVQVDAAQGQHRGVAGAELLGDAAAARRPVDRESSSDRVAVTSSRSSVQRSPSRPFMADSRTHDSRNTQPRKTIAGSSTSTLRTLSRLASRQMTGTHPATSSATWRYR